MSASLTLAYCWPNIEGDPQHTNFAMRFLNSYSQHGPMIDHRSVILTDPGELPEEFEMARVVLPNCSIFQCDAPGKDLSRYFAYAAQCPTDILLMLGGSTYLRRPGWGITVIRSFETLGASNLYGACGHTGQGPVRPHVRSTGMWASPKMLSRYPIRPHDHGTRYQVEHGQGCLSDWFRSQGHQTLVVSFNGHWALEHANDDVQGYARGSQQSLLFGDRLTSPPYQPFP